MLNRLRMQRGLFWKSKYPPFPRKSALTVLACIATYTLVAHIDDLEAREQQMGEKWSAQMADCLNGKWRGLAEDGTQIVCMPAERFHPSERSAVR